MTPMIVITDAVQDKGDEQMREKTVALFGHVIYKRSECYPVAKDKPMGFNTNGTSLTYVEDD